MTDWRAKRRARSHQLIADAAARLFCEHGFEKVTMAHVADEAGVARQTVFNHFPVKEDLVFDEIEAQREALLSAIDERPTGTSPAVAVRDQLIARWRTVQSVPEQGGPDSGIFHLVHSSPSLQRHQIQMNAQTAQILAPALDLQDQMVAKVIAGALVSIEQAVFDGLAEHVASGGAVEDIRDRLLVQALSAFERIGVR